MSFIEGGASKDRLTSPQIKVQMIDSGSGVNVSKVPHYLGSRSAAFPLRIHLGMKKTCFARS